MRFNVARIRNIETCSLVCFLDQLDLRLHRGGGNGGCLSILVQSTSSNDAVNAITVPQSGF